MRALVSAAFCLFLVAPAHAGTIADGKWSPSGCGAAPGDPPRIVGTSGEAYDKSVAAGHDYAKAAETYSNCMIAEGEVDGRNIEASAATGHERIVATLNALGRAQRAAAAKLQGQVPPPDAAPAKSVAETLTPATWMPASCGAAPGEAPAIADASVAAFNESAARAKEFQVKAAAYHDCMMDEAAKSARIIRDSIDSSDRAFHEKVAALTQDALQEVVVVGRKESSDPADDTKW